MINEEDWPIIDDYEPLIGGVKRLARQQLTEVQQAEWQLARATIQQKHTYIGGSCQRRSKSDLSV